MHDLNLTEQALFSYVRMIGGVGVRVPVSDLVPLVVQSAELPLAILKLIEEGLVTTEKRRRKNEMGHFSA